MNRIYIYLVAVLFLLLGSSTAEAQIWADLTPFFEQLDNDDRSDFSNNLDELIETFDYSSIELHGVIDSLLNGLEVLDMGSIDSMLLAWGNNRDDLILTLGNGDFNMLDSLFIISEYDRVNALWYLNLDSLNQLLDQYQDTTATYDPNLANEAADRFEVFEGLWTQIFGDLQAMVEGGFDATDPDGFGNFASALDTLFSSMFDLELAFGQEFAQAKFYEEAYGVTTSVIRLGSVPRFNTDWEARWHVQGSFFNNNEEIMAETNTIEEGFNNFLCNAQFAIMYNPIISQERGNIFRLYTSLGMEMGTYVPAHVRPGDPSTEPRVGNTTGYGPQIGAGMVVNTGDISFYTFGTLATGDVIDENSFWAGNGYRFNSSSVNAGLRYGNVVNILYTYGTGSWARNENKFVEYNRVSIGIILDALRRGPRG